MAVLFVDGFDHYQWADVGKKWTPQGFSPSSTPPDINGDIRPEWARPPGGMGWRTTLGDINRRLERSLGANIATLICGGNHYFSTYGSGRIMGFFDSGTEQVSVRIDGTGRIVVSRNGTTLATSTNVLALNTWYHIEFKATIHNTTGTYEVRVNGTSTGWIPPATGQNTRTTANNYATHFALGQATPDHRADDLYCLDTSGAVSNDFIGPQKIITLLPNGAGNYAQWSGNYAANFANVNELTGDEDDTFNQSSTAGQVDTHAFDNVPPGTVYGIQHNILARQDAGAQRQIRPKQRSGATDYSGATVNLAGSYLYYCEAATLDPSTAAQWTDAGVNAAEFGYELVS